MTTLAVEAIDTVLAVTAPAPTTLVAALDPPLVLQVAPQGAMLAVAVVQTGVLTAPAAQGPAGPVGPAGTTGPVATIVCADAVPSSGLPVYVDRTSRQVRLARSDTYRAAFVSGLATAPAAVGFTTLVSCGQVVLSDWTAATGAADLMPGLVYFLAPSGGLTAVPPVGLPGVAIVTVGRAADARTLFVAPSNPILQ